MTINSTTRKAGPFIGNGTTTAFPFAYKVFQASDLLVVRLDTTLNIEQELTLNTDYTVTLNLDQDSNPGGTVNLLAALATGYTLTLTSDLANLQPTDLTNQGGFYPDVINDALDRATIQIQQLQEQTDRSLKVALSSDVNATLPPPNPNDLIGWDATGEALVNVDPNSIGTVVAYATAYCDVFVGNGITTSWTLTRNPAVLYNLDVSINGSSQEPTRDYTLSGTTFTMTTPPPIGARVVVKYKEGLPNFNGDSQDVRYVPASGPATNVQARLRTHDAKLDKTVYITDFGADVGASAAANTAAIQAAIDACPQGGSVFIPNGTFQINDALIISKAMTIRGDGTGKFMSSLGGSIIKQTNNTKNAFTLRASVAQWAFGQYGLNNVNFQDFTIEGPSGYPGATNFAPRGIGCDTTVNGGDYHIRECTFTNMVVRFFNTGIELVGICYLNDFFGGAISFCNTGFALYKGVGASDRGGQTRFFGTTIDLITDACIQWNTDTNSGDLSLFGCTLADAQYGIVSNEEAQLMISGCSFEAIRKTGGLGAGIYMELKELNANSDSAKTIIGNKFYNNDCSIWLNKTSTASSGQFSWPMLIDGNTIIDAEALRITIPAGEQPMSGQNFVLGAANSGLNVGFLSASQVSTNFAGRDMRKHNLTRRVQFGPTDQGRIILPAGMVVTGARMYLTANASGFTNLFGGDSVDNARYYGGINGQTAPLNTWTTWTPPVPQHVIDNELKQDVVLSGTGGLLGATGIFEIEGYIP